MQHQPKTGNELRCFGRVHIYCSTSATVEIAEKVFKILHRKLPIEQHEPLKPGMNSSVPEEFTFTAPLVIW